MAEETLAAQCAHGVAVANVVALYPAGEGFLLPGGRKAGVEEQLVAAKARKLTVAEQHGVLVQAAENHVAPLQQVAKRHEAVALHCRSSLLAAGEIAYLRAEEAHRVGNHPARLSQPDDARFQPRYLARHAKPRLHAEAVKAAHERTHYVFHHTFVAIVAYAGHGYAVSLGITDVNVGALRRVKGAAHTHIPHLRAAGKHVAGNGRRVAEQHGVGIADAPHYLVGILRDVGIHHHFSRHGAQPLLGPWLKAHWLYGHKFPELFHFNICMH